MNRAQNTVNPERIKRVEDGVYQVLSSKGDRAYMVTDDSCECAGFRYRKTCSHQKAVKNLE